MEVTGGEEEISNNNYLIPVYLLFMNSGYGRKEVPGEGYGQRWRMASVAWQTINVTTCLACGSYACLPAWHGIQQLASATVALWAWAAQHSCVL